MAQNRFNFDKYIPTYPSVRAMLADYLNDLRYEIPGHVYDAVFDCFLNNDKKPLADLLAKVCAKMNVQRVELRQKTEKIDRLEEEAEQLRKKENQLEMENMQLKLKLQDVYRSEAGLDLRIRDMYVEEKKSLNEIARIIEKDKKTVKNRLVKMNVYDRRDEDDEDVIKLLAEHLQL